ncbi:histidine kinase [Pontibacter sp. 172403-2]|uniref:sensor histidine kinase n=1 Tax=Pontibacter rufus TaxID=2791028 RepID=UPI0018AFB61F|nr:ATP-binding protein [Pontibacter sp. 172403-2]MBF9255105.1 histidine kinase [Pontibacter sp. 172403-2]
MHFFSFLAAFLLARRLRSLLKESYLYPKWNNLLNVSSWIILILFFVAGSFFEEVTSGFIGSMLLLGMLVYLDKEPDFKIYRPLIEANYPLLAVGLLRSLVQAIAPEFYENWDEYFEFALVGAFIWIFARWANSKKQLQELRIAEDRKAELEVLVAERTTELTQQQETLQATIKELQAMQAQLVQQEKLASLGELTAGIAHEIQNPLNFVNNFSELSTELLDELKAGPWQTLQESEKEYAADIMQDLTKNLQKISFHGKRAESIVKGMLQHSRASTGQKELTDLNALADEYLRLSYHGLRAKDNTFNAKLETSFDVNLPRLEVVPQDIGRVLLNLFNNAFYAVQQKKAARRHDDSYQPLVRASTACLGDTLELRIRDNGCGIPESIRHKILQPFFTTKPTGQGTGLGLSLSYDIITKGHHGEMLIESEDGEFSEFIIRLPVKASNT